VRGGFEYSFPAVRGIQAEKEYFVTMCPLRIIPRLFQFEDELMPAEFRAQRVLNRSRIPDIADYILENPSTYVFSSLTASIDGQFRFVPTKELQDLGTIFISMDSRFVINDGQHRRAAIEEALKQRPELGAETISVVFFSDQGLRQSQQMFSDLNKHAVNTTRSIGILYDSRDELANATKLIVRQLPLLRDYTEMEHSTLPKYSPKLFTLSNIYGANSRLIGYRRGVRISDNQIDRIGLFWATLCDCIDEWKLVRDKQMKASTLRMQYLHSYGIVLDAVAIVVNRVNRAGQDAPAVLRRIGQLNWSRSNLEDWGECVLSPTGRVSRNAQNAKRTAEKIIDLLELELH